MKLLLDANLSWRLSKSLLGHFSSVLHVEETELPKPAKDVEIWNYAAMHGYIILTNDLDFQNLLMLRGFPPKIILLKSGNLKTKSIADIIIRHLADINDLCNNPEAGILELVFK